MKTIILAGGLGTRMGIETKTKPKPMVEIGSRPILWHIMRGYAQHGCNDFIITLGYKGDEVKRFWSEEAELMGDMTVYLGQGFVRRHEPEARPDWTVRLIDTGFSTDTGGRIKRVAHLLDDVFMMTFGDGVSNVDITALIEFHRSHGKLATLTAVRPPARFGHLNLDEAQVTDFEEKPETGEGWINGGFFVLDRRVLDYIEGDETHFQREPLSRLAKDGELMAYRHEGFWQCMDNLRDRELLERLWASGNAPWKTWG